MWFTKPPPGNAVRQKFCDKYLWHIETMVLRSMAFCYVTRTRRVTDKRIDSRTTVFHSLNKKSASHVNSRANISAASAKCGRFIVLFMHLISPMPRRSDNGTYRFESRVCRSLFDKSFKLVSAVSCIKLKFGTRTKGLWGRTEFPSYFQN